MPVISLKINVSLPDIKQEYLCKDIAVEAAKILGKNPDTAMVTYTECSIFLNNTSDNAVFFDIESIGIDNQEKQSIICNKLYEILKKYIEIDSSRIFLNFIDVNPSFAWKFQNGYAESLESIILSKKV